LRQQGQIANCTFSIAKIIVLQKA